MKLGRTKRSTEVRASCRVVPMSAMFTQLALGPERAPSRRTDTGGPP